MTLLACENNAEKLNSDLSRCADDLQQTAEKLTTTSSVKCSTPEKAHFCNDESSNDSTSLQIVVPDSVRKRRHSVSFDIDKEIENDIEMSLETKQRKTNLSVKNVKSILRYVIENESVLAMINNSMKGPGLDVEPKITRSKARQLRKENHIMWPLSPIQVSVPDLINKEHLVLIQEELPEEEDDDEYRPTLDDLDNSDDESGRQSVGTPSLDVSTAGRYLENFDPRLLDDSVPLTNAVALSEVEPELVDLTFKRPMGCQKPESIGQRTRSKYSLSSTPLETIEQAFVPPDITTDMYDFKSGDQEWENFLKQFMQPLPIDPADPDEDDDPEYNAMAEVEQIDKEELRRDKAVKVPRAEVRKLMEELAGGSISSEDDEEEQTALAPALTTPPQIPLIEIEHLPTNSPEPEIIGITLHQQMLLVQQLRQHVQLCTQSFLQVHCHPVYAKQATNYKVMLADLVELSKLNDKSIVNVFNLRKSFLLVEEWEKLLITAVGKHIIRHTLNEYSLAKEAKKSKLVHRLAFHPVLMSIIVHSNLFNYPTMLPHQPFSGDFTNLRTTFVNSEDHLIAIGLEQMVPYVNEHLPQNSSRKTMIRAAELIHQLLMPAKLAVQIHGRINSMKGVIGNPIWHYTLHGSAPPTTHQVTPFNGRVRPKDNAVKLLPPCWAEFVGHLKSCEENRCCKCGKAVVVPSVSKDS